MSSPTDLDRAGTTGYFLNLPKLESNFSEDVGLHEYLRTIADIPRDVREDWERFGRRCVDELDSCAKEMEEYKPRVEQFEATGQLSNRVVTCGAWKRMKQISAEEGLVALGYVGRKLHNELGIPARPPVSAPAPASDGKGAGDAEECPVKNLRLHQLVKLHLFVPSSGMYGCPLSMTDATCKLADVHGGSSAWLREVFGHCTSCDAARFWTSGQWITERGGGSDVGSGTRTVARRVAGEPGRFLLDGYKWFSSAADGEVAIALAVIEGQSAPSCFGVETRESLGEQASNPTGLQLPPEFFRELASNPTGRQLPPEFFSNTQIKPSIRVVQLKDKLGTRALPTAELELSGLEATLIGAEGEGIKVVSSMLNITRLNNGVASTGFMSRALMRAKGFAQARTAFGRPLAASALHVQNLLQLEAVYRSSLYLTLDAARAIGELERLEDEAGCSVGCSLLPDTLSAEDRFATLQRMVRGMTPVVKLYTAKHAVQVVSECLEHMGGLGYLEASEMPQILRDAQVLPVWEGTTNVCAIDVARVFRGSDVLKTFQDMYYLAAPPTSQRWPAEWSTIFEDSFDKLDKFLRRLAADTGGKKATTADHPLLREGAYSLSRLLAVIAAARVWRRQPSRANALVVETLLFGLSDLRAPIVDARLSDEKESQRFDLDVAREVVFGADAVRASKL